VIPGKPYPFSLDDWVAHLREYEAFLNAEKAKLAPLLRAANRSERRRRRKASR
jgi:hypothetical protein